MLKSILTIVMLLSLSGTAHAQTRVIDGDTLELNGITYRLNGIDAPEFGQVCNGPKGGWKCGVDALEKLADLTRRATIRCKPITKDPYDRIVATCSANGKDLGAAMVASGYAWAFLKFSDVYLTEETAAKSRNLGIWSAANQPAWDFRSARWAVAKQAAPNGCPIKGNITRNGHIYHPPWSPWYDRTRINLAKGERWFCDEAEAIAAGWRAPRWP